MTGDVWVFNLTCACPSLPYSQVDTLYMVYPVGMVLTLDTLTGVDVV